MFKKCKQRANLMREIINYLVDDKSKGREVGKEQNSYSGVSRVGLKGGFQKSQMYVKWLVKVGASNGVTPWIKKIMAGGFRAPRKPPGYATVLGIRTYRPYALQNKHRDLRKITEN